ncbi:FAD-binding protein, partial [bacterium]
AVYLDFADAIKRDGREVIRQKYGNLFHMYEKITGENPYHTPMKIYPAPHYTMGGLWVDYNLESTIPGLFVLGEANFSDHGANRLGASALMQGLADGYFIAPYTVGQHLAGRKLPKVSTDGPEFEEALRAAKGQVERLLKVKGQRSVDSFHRELGRIMWNNCGMSRNEAGLKEAIAKIRALREEFWSNVKILGGNAELNQSLEQAGRVADFIELGELMCRDALNRRESCGGHFREESQTEENEAKRDDDNYLYVSAWQHQGDDKEPVLHKEPLQFESIHLTQRSYK